MDFKQRTLNELSRAAAAAAERRAVVGLDGFVDTIVAPVDLRAGPGEAFTPIPTLAALGQRIAGAAGKSTNIELYPRLHKLGGNGPIMANALLAHGLRLTYIGALGTAALHPVFHDMAQRAHVISVAEPAATTAVECLDGKLMLGQTRSLDDVTFDRLVEHLGRDGLVQTLATADLIGLTNWTMIAGMTEIFSRLVEEILPNLPARERRYFFDLADPEKRSHDDLLAALRAIGRFETFGRVTLGLNLKEAQRVGSVLELPSQTEDADGLRGLAQAIRNRLALDCVVVHPKESAACATARGTSWVPGPYCDKPLITTGAGDHFNAGFSTAQLLGLDDESCLALGVCTSGHYVRTGQSPSLADLQTFLANWA